MLKQGPPLGETALPPKFALYHHDGKRLLNMLPFDENKLMAQGGHFGYAMYSPTHTSLRWAGYLLNLQILENLDIGTCGG